MSDEILNQILTKLNIIEKKMENTVTKEDIVNMATKEDLESMATKEDIEKIYAKLDTLYAQVAHNTEQEFTLNEVKKRVTEHDTDIRLIKRALSQ